MTKPKRIESLSGLRFVFMMIIMLSHMEFLENTPYGSIYTRYLHNASIGVDFFFILSGFMMSWNYDDRQIDVSVKSAVSFWAKKIKKFYFIYLISMAICIPYNVIQMQSAGKSIIATSIIAVVRTVVCIPLAQSLFGVTALSHSFNGVCWFLSTTSILYLFTPILLDLKHKMKRSRRIYGCLFIGCIFLIPVVYSLFQHIEKVSIFDDLKYGSPYIRVLYYICGMFLCDLYRYIRVRFDLVKDMSLLEGGNSAWSDMVDVI